MGERPGPMVVTGAAGERPTPLRLAVGLLGWLLLIAFVFVLTTRASLGALHVAVFLVVVVTVVALLSIALAVQVLRAGVIRDRLLPPDEADRDDTIDALGRRVESPSPALTGEIVLVTDERGRRYLEGYRP